jgi:hypothetical protein
MGTEPGSVKSKSEKTKEKKPKAKKELLVTRYSATAKAETEAGKKLLASETQKASVLRVCRKPATFPEVIESLATAMKGKKESTVANNVRWYLSKLRAEGYLKSTDSREDAK